MTIRSLTRLTLSLASALVALSVIWLVLDRPAAQAQPLNAPSGVTRPYPGASPCNTTLQACISASADGDSVLVSPGTYVTASLSITRAVNLIGAGVNPAGVKLRPTSGRMIQYSAATITNTTVISNLTVENGDAGGSSGGGIRVLSGSGAPLFHSIVVSNNLGASGAGIRIIPSIPVTMVNVTVFSNTSSSMGGGISADGDLTLINSRIERNRAAGDGGGISASSVLISGTQFISNTAKNGGGLNVVSGSMAITNTSFLSNTASAGGGAIHALTSTLTLASTTFMTATTFQHNTASNGGALLLSGPAALVVNKATFRDNHVVVAGGAISLLNGAGPLSIRDSRFIDNSAGLGGALLISSASSVTLIGNNFYTRNTATAGAGGAILNFGTLVFFSFGMADFSLNQAQTTGGAIENSAGADVHSGSTIGLSGDVCGAFPDSGNARFSSNSAVAGDGGAIHNAGSLRLDGGFFSQNTGKQGGALASDGDVVLNLLSFLVNNGTSGGAVFISGTLQMTGTHFTSNNASLSGGGVFVRGAVTSIANSFNGNGSAGDGGGMLVDGKLDDTCSSFEANTAGGDAGGLMGATGSVFTLSSTEFLSNTALNLGGGVRAGGVITANGVLYRANQARLGGGLFADNESSLSANQFIANLAATGGGLLQNRKDARIVNSLFARNSISTTTGTGAAMMLNLFEPVSPPVAGTVVLVHNTIAGPSLSAKAAVAVLSGTLSITDTIVVSNFVGISALSGTTTTCANPLFFGNTTNRNGVICSGEVSGNPQFVDAGADDYHIAANSAALDSGIDAGVNTDFEGDPRPLGAGFDIGFDERGAAPFNLYLPLILR